MSNFNTNINPEAMQAMIDAENERKKNLTKVGFDQKNYLDIRLKKTELTKTLTIRLLPYSETNTTPFEKVSCHTIKVNKEVAESGWKTLPCPTHSHMGDTCPICALAEQARKKSFEATTEAEKKQMIDIAKANRVSDMWVFRCIERGHEDDGVKFCRVSNAKDGLYAKIMGVWNARWNKAKAKGLVNNIFDLNNGKDLEITITKDANGKQVFSVVDADEKTPLTEDYEKGMSWINDSKTWTDVYKVQSAEYMEILINGGVPIFDKVKQKFVDRDELKKEQEAAATAELAEKLTESTVDYSTIQPQVLTPITPIVETNSDSDIPF